MRVHNNGESLEDAIRDFQMSFDNFACCHLKRERDVIKRFIYLNKYTHKCLFNVYKRGPNTCVKDLTIAHLY